MPKEGVLLHEYLAHVMSAPSVRSQIEERAAGSDMRNISQSAIREITVPLPVLDEQCALGEGLTACLQLVERIGDELSTLRNLRSTLVTSLLNQSISIPESYDALLEQGKVVAS
ncbi:MAG: hypothetical protein ACRDXB_19600 [Actinomycetes bacterium]